MIASPVATVNPAEVNTPQAIQVIADPVTANPVVNVRNLAQIDPVQANPVQADLVQENPVQANAVGTDLTQADLGIRGASNGELIDSQLQNQEIPDSEENSNAQSRIDLGKVTRKQPNAVHIKPIQTKTAQQSPDQVLKQETLSTNFQQIPVQSKPNQPNQFVTNQAQIYQGPLIQADSRIDIENRVFTDTSNLRNNLEYDRENILRNTANIKDLSANDKNVATDISSYNSDSASDIGKNYEKVSDNSENSVSLKTDIENNTANVTNINSEGNNASSSQLSKNTMWALFQSLFNSNPQNKFQISPGQNIPLQETSLQDSGNNQETQNESPTQIFSSQDTSDPYKFNIFVYNNNNYNTHHNYHIYDHKKNS